MATGPRQRTGRRPGTSGTREAIAEAAKRRFAELGYDRTTIRGVAEEAGVDPALVSHFFGSKQKLFITVMELPFEPEEVLPEIFAGPRSKLGERIAHFVVENLDDPQVRGVVTGILRAASSEPEVARMVREQVATRILDAIAENLGVEDARLRASLIQSQVIGLAMARCVIGVEPLASLPADELVTAIAPNLQRYLTGPLGDI
jgi:AcrR family transcriptional regulator